MRPDIVPGGTFPDYELPDHTSTPRRLSELQGDDPLILTLARGHYCPKEHQQHLELAAFYPKIAVAYTQIATISTDDHHTLQEFRASVGAQWTFLSDPDRTVQKDLDIQEYTDPENNPMIPHTLVLKPGLVIHSIYNGYWFWGRPSVVDLWHDLRAVTSEIRPDWDLSTPGLREAWDAGDFSPLPRVEQAAGSETGRGLDGRRNDDRNIHNRSGPPCAGAARADRRRDRRQRGHRARDGPARARGGSRRDPHRARPGSPAPRRPRARRPSIAAFDATDFDRLGRFFDELPTPIDHVLVTGPGPYYAPLAEFDVDKARRDVEAHLLLPLQVARHAAGKVRPGGTLLFMGGTGGRRTAPGLAFISALTAAMPALTKNLALELAPIRVNLIAAGFVDTPLSAALLGDQLDARREQLRTTLPIRRVVGPADIAALAVHLMTNTAVTGATFDIDGGQQLVEG